MPDRLVSCQLSKQGLSGHGGPGVVVRLDSRFAKPVYCADHQTPHDRLRIAMAPKKNPLNLNPLQLRTLTLLQEIARLENKPGAEEGAFLITGLPHAHGNHFHLGHAVVSAKDATGLHNDAVWTILERKGVVKREPGQAVLTAVGAGYDTGLREEILHHSDH